MKTLRKPIAFLLLVLISLQVGGYYAVLEYMKLQLSEKTAQRLASEQTPIGAQLVLKIPVWSSGSNSYSSTGNHFTFHGNVYQVIERHVYEDTLYIVCIRDDRATDAQETIDSFVQSLAGKNNNDQGAGIKFFENLTKYFCSEHYSWLDSATSWTSDLQFGTENILYSFNHEDLPFHPPSVNC